MAEKCAEVNEKLLMHCVILGGIFGLDEVALPEDKHDFELKDGYSAKTVCRMNIEHAGEFARLAINPNNWGRSSGVFFLWSKVFGLYDKLR